MRKVGGDERFGHIVQAGKRNVIATTTQLRQRALHRRVTENRFESLANYREYHAGVTKTPLVLKRYFAVSYWREFFARLPWWNIRGLPGWRLPRHQLLPLPRGR
jgi:hypothetical protein